MNDKLYIDQHCLKAIKTWRIIIGWINLQEDIHDFSKPKKRISRNVKDIRTSCKRDHKNYRKKDELTGAGKTQRSKNAKTETFYRFFYLL